MQNNDHLNVAYDKSAWYLIQFPSFFFVFFFNIEQFLLVIEIHCGHEINQQTNEIEVLLEYSGIKMCMLF